MSDDLEQRVEQLEDAIAELKPDGVSRRSWIQALAAGGAAGAFSGAGFLAGQGQASAAASTSDGDGDVGTPSNPVDAYLNGVTLDGDVSDNSGNTLIDESVPAWNQQVGTSGSPAPASHFQSLTTDVADIVTELDPPEYDDVSNAPAEDGTLVYVTGDGATTPEGLYQRQSGSYTQVGGSGGSAVVLDLGDDGSNESTDLSEIATSNDTNSIVTEPSADKALFDMSANWPTADSVPTDAIGTSELDLSITPTWTGTHTFSEINNDNYVESQATASEGTSYNADLTTANYHKVTMTGDVTFDFTNPDGSDVNSLILHLVQDATGSRSPSFTPTVVWADGSAPSWSTAANAEDVVTFVHDQDGSQWLGFEGGLNFS